MLDMTTVGSVGMFIGVWGMASALARLTGNMLSGVVREGVAMLAHNGVSGYNTVFILEIVMLVVSLFILQKVDVSLFKKQAEEVPYLERAAIASEV
jgi:BCD family chlorophyll transporter-like MFS transporter